MQANKYKTYITITFAVCLKQVKRMDCAHENAWRYARVARVCGLRSGTVEHCQEQHINEHLLFANPNNIIGKVRANVCLAKWSKTFMSRRRFSNAIRQKEGTYACRWPVDGGAVYYNCNTPTAMTSYSASLPTQQACEFSTFCCA